MINVTSINSLFAILLFLTWDSVLGQGRQSMDDLRKIPEQDIYHLKDGRVGHSIPDMRVVLNNLLRYENTAKLHPAASEAGDSDHIFTLSSRSKGAAINSDDPLAVIASGFHGSRGKRPSYDEIPIFANGFPANRGRK